jgi:propionyl-CoA carboxylase alpha chain
MVTGLDLVELQLSIAAGEPLPVSQEDITWKGWAIEARICAEDPNRSFLPSTGMITRYAPARGRNIRLDSGIKAGSIVSVYYDSLLAKVIAWGETRQEAIDTLVRSLNGYHIEGPASTVSFVNSILTHPAFREGRLSTGFIDEHFAHGVPILAPPPERLQLMAMAAVVIYHNRQRLTRESLKPMAAHVGTAHLPKEFYSYMVRNGDDVFNISIGKGASSREWLLTVNGVKHVMVAPEFEFYRRRLRLRIDGESHMFRLHYQYSFLGVAFCGTIRVFEVFSPREWELAKHMPAHRDEPPENVLICPMPGLVVAVQAEKGDRVYRGQDLICIESMKIETFVASPRDGVVEEVLVTVGQAVETDQVLVRFK